MTVPVLVSATFVMDGNAQPIVGETVTYRLRFAEVTEDEDPDPELGRWWDVVATPVGEPHRSWPLGGEPRGPWFWSTAVHGPGWSATWSAPRRVEGAVRLRGQLSADYDVSTLDTTVTGRVTRVRVITQAETPYTGGALGRLVVGSRAYRDVEASPLAFDDNGRGFSRRQHRLTRRTAAALARRDARCHRAARSRDGAPRQHRSPRPPAAGSTSTSTRRHQAPEPGYAVPAAGPPSTGTTAA